MNFRKRVDRLLIKATRIFGEKVTFFPKVGGTFTVNAVFDTAYQVVDPETQELISSNKPALGVNLNDFEEIPVVGDQVEVESIRFRITSKQEDGQGGAVLFLNKVNASDRLDNPRTR